MKTLVIDNGVGGPASAPNTLATRRLSSPRSFGLDLTAIRIGRRMVAGVLGLLLAAGLSAQAITVQEFSVYPYQTPTITCTGIGTVTVYAGVNKLGVDGVPMDGFCIDPFHFSMSSSAGYDYVPLTGAPKGGYEMDAMAARDIQRLWASYYETATGNADIAAGLQIAIWEVVGGGSFALNSGNDYGASSFLEAIHSSAYEGGEANVIALTGPGQDYVVRNVPDGGLAALLLAMGLVGIGCARMLAESGRGTARQVYGAIAPRICRGAFFQACL